MTKSNFIKILNKYDKKLHKNSKLNNCLLNKICKFKI